MKETSIRRIDLVVKATVGLAIAAILASPAVKFSHPDADGQRGAKQEARQVPVPDPGYRVRVDPSIPDTMERVSDIELLAETVLLEARGEGRRGMIAVANVIVNRMRVRAGRIPSVGWYGSRVSSPAGTTSARRLSVCHAFRSVCVMKRVRSPSRR